MFCLMCGPFLAGTAFFITCGPIFILLCGYFCRVWSTLIYIRFIHNYVYNLALGGPEKWQKQERPLRVLCHFCLV